MANQTKITFQTEILEDIGNGQFKSNIVQSLIQELIHTSQGSGVKVLAPSASDDEFLPTSRIVIFQSVPDSDGTIRDFTIKVAGTGNTAITCSMFSYRGAKATFHFGNPDAGVALSVNFMNLDY